MTLALLLDLMPSCGRAQKVRHAPTTGGADISGHILVYYHHESTLRHFANPTWISKSAEQRPQRARTLNKPKLHTMRPWKLRPHETMQLGYKVGLDFVGVELRMKPQP